MFSCYIDLAERTKTSYVAAPIYNNGGAMYNIFAGSPVYVRRPKRWTDTFTNLLADF
jgi:hypothetical protein